MPHSVIKKDGQCAQFLGHVVRLVIGGGCGGPAVELGQKAKAGQPQGTATGAKFTHVPYGGGSKAVVALLSVISSRSRLDTAAVERQVAQELSVQTGQTTTVQCPDSVALEAGATFTCSAGTTDGRNGKVEVTQDDDEGNVTWRLAS